MARVPTLIRIKAESSRYTPKLIQAMDEALRISRDPNVAGYTNMDDLQKALEE